MKRLVLFLISATIVSSVSATTLPTATLTLAPDHVLPGLPVAFIVTFINPNPVRVTVINGMDLSVTTSTGAFMASGLGGRTTTGFSREQVERCDDTYLCLIVPPNGQRQLFIPFGSTLADNEFFADPRLSMPGEYDLQLRFAISIGDEKPVEIMTNVARFTVIEPTGADLAVWRRMQQISGQGDWTIIDWVVRGDFLAEEIRSKYPTSGYFPWVGTFGEITTPAAAFAQTDAALARNPPPVLRDELLRTEAAFADRESGNALHVDRDLDSALALADVARTAYTALAKDAVSLGYRKTASEALTHVYTRRTAEEELRELAELDPPAPEKLVPRVECVSPGNGQSFTARFGYVNPNAVNKVLTLSSLNEFTPAPANQGQPHVFSPGAHANVFTASSPGGELKWHLDGNVATATADFPTRCVAPVAAAK